MVELRLFALVGCALVATALAHGAELNRSIQARLSSDRLGHLEPGKYLAGDKAEFELNTTGSSYLLRCNGSPEVFVVTADSAAMGGRVLRYDSGETALQVSGWGGVTLYTDTDPEGLPAIRTGDPPTFLPTMASSDDIRTAGRDFEETLARQLGLNLGLSIDWSGLTDTSRARGRALDAIENVARAIERLGRSARLRKALSGRISAIVLGRGQTPAAKLSGKTLLITFDPDAGYEGRASSRAVASALRTLLSAPQKQS